MDWSQLPYVGAVGTVSLGSRDDEAMERMGWEPFTGLKGRHIRYTIFCHVSSAIDLIYLQADFWFLC